MGLAFLAKFGVFLAAAKGGAFLAAVLAFFFGGGFLAAILLLPEPSARLLGDLMEVTWFDTLGNLACSGLARFTALLHSARSAEKSLLRFSDRVTPDRAFGFAGHRLAT